MVGDGACEVLVGASSWADRSLVRDGHFYPRPSMRAAERLGHYASRLRLAEITATRFFPPTPEQSMTWAARTPPSFRFDVAAWGLFAGAACHSTSLWPDLQDEVRPEAREKPRLYREHLSEDALLESWVRFRAAVQPLADAGRLGVITFRLAQWLKPGRTSTAILEEARAALDGWRVAVELPNHRWHEGGAAEETLALLEDLDLALVCVDAASNADRPDPLIAATTDHAHVRFAGRRPGRWPWPWRYADDELERWLPTLEKLASGCRTLHCTFSNTAGDDAVSGALALRELVDPQPVQGTLF